MSGQPSSKAGAKPISAATTAGAAGKPAGPSAVKPLASAPGIVPVVSPAKAATGVPPKMPTAKVGSPPVIAKAAAPVALASQMPAAPVPQALRPVPPKNRGSTSSDGVGAVDVVPMSLTGTAWPCNVPSNAQASQLFSADRARADKDGPSGKLWSSLTETETNALMGQQSSLDLTALRHATLVRWRLANALETKPPPGSPVDVAALEQLLNEADAALSKVQVPDAATEAVRAGYASARRALAKEAVALSEVAAEFAQHAAADAAARKATKKYQHVARIVATTTNTAKIALRSKVLWAGFAVSLLGAGAFHGYRYLQERNAPKTGPSYSAAGMHGYKNDSTGVTVLHSVDPTIPVNEAELAKLKAEAEASGKRVHQVGLGEYIIAPKDMRIMGDPSQKPPAQP